MPSGRFAANGAWLAVQVDGQEPGPLDGPDRLGRADRTTKTLRRRVFSGGTDHLKSSARRGRNVTFASSPALANGSRSSAAPWPGCRPFQESRPARRPPGCLTQRPRNLAPPRSRESPAAYPDRHRAHRNSPALGLRFKPSSRRLDYRAAGLQHLPQGPGRSKTCSSLTVEHPLPLSSRRPDPCPSVDSGLSQTQPSISGTPTVGRPWWSRPGGRAVCWCISK